MTSLLSTTRPLRRKSSRSWNPELLINHMGRPYQRYGIDDMMDRLKERTGF